MLIYWNAGQPGFWDPSHDGAGLDLATPLGFEPLIARDPLALRRECLDLLRPAEPALWLDPDPGVGPLVPEFATPEQAEAALARITSSSNAASASPTTTKPPGVSRVAVLRLERPDWIVVAFRGTTPSPLRGLLREGQVNSMAGQETWAEAPTAMRGARVHRGYAAAYRTVCAEVESALKTRLLGDAFKDDASSSLKGGSEGSNVTGSKRPRVVIVGHSLGGALAALCAARLAHDPEVVVLDDEKAGVAGVGAGVGPDAAAASSSEESSSSSPTAVSCVTFGQPRVGDGGFRRGVDAAHAAGRLTYQRVVRGGDLFARVPTSGVWLPGGNEDRFGVAYEHAGSMVWAEVDAAIGAGVGEPAPPGFNSDWRMINPARVASDHAGYAYFFEDDALKKAWPRTRS